jgi:hypothetical protein
MLMHFNLLVLQLQMYIYIISIHLALIHWLLFNVDLCVKYAT